MPSIVNVAVRMNFVNLTMPPSFGAATASCMVVRWKIPIRCPVRSSVAAATVMTPRPPIWMSRMMMVWPKADHPVAVSRTMRPVTQTALVAVNSASSNGALSPSLEATGSVRSSAPRSMTRKNPARMSRKGFLRYAVESVRFIINAVSFLSRQAAM